MATMSHAVLLTNAYLVAKLYSPPEISDAANPGYPLRYWGTEHSTRQDYRPSRWQVLFICEADGRADGHFHRPNVPAKLV